MFFTFDSSLKLQLILKPNFQVVIFHCQAKDEYINICSEPWELLSGDKNASEIKRNQISTIKDEVLENVAKILNTPPKHKHHHDEL